MYIEVYVVMPLLDSGIINQAFYTLVDLVIDYLSFNVCVARETNARRIGAH